MTLKVTFDPTAESGPGMTGAEIDAYLAQATCGFTQAQIEAAFESVQDAQHWKNPINAIVDRAQIEVLTRAIPYYTGTPAFFDDVEGQPGKVRVTADGYYAGNCN